MNVCKALCELSGVRAPLNSDPYGRGLRRCRRCDMFFETSSKACPCCGALLRIGPRYGRGRAAAGGPKGGAVRA